MSNLKLCIKGDVIALRKEHLIYIIDGNLRHIIKRYNYDAYIDLEEKLFRIEINIDYRSVNKKFDEVKNKIDREFKCVAPPMEDSAIGIVDLIDSIVDELVYRKKTGF